MEKLVLIDGNSLINRAFYAMPLLTTKTGQFTNGVYGFMNMLTRLIAEEKPTRIAVAFDVHAPTFRHEMYKDYKGTRKPMPLELRPQIPLLHDLLSKMGIYTIEKAGLEADDIIGTLANRSPYKTLIFTGDRDSFQLVGDKTEVHFTKRGISETEIYTAENFKEKTGINPKQIIDLKALMGDSSDNIPGVFGIGEKTAKTLVETYGTLDNVYAHTEELPEKTRAKIEAGKDSAYLSYTLATINTDADIDIDFEKMRFSFPFPASVKKEFLSLEFKSLYSKDNLFIKDETPIEKPTSTAKIEHIKTLDGKQEYIFHMTNSLFDEGLSISDLFTYLKPLFCGEKTLIVFDKKQLMHFTFDNFGYLPSANFEDVGIIKYLANFSGKVESVKDVIVAYGKDENCPATAIFEIYLALKEKLIAEKMTDLYRNVELPLIDVLFSMEETGFKVDYDALDSISKQFHEFLSKTESEIRAVADEPTLNVNSPKQLGDVLFEKLKVGKGKKTKSGYSTSADVLESLETAHPIIPLILKYRRIQKLQSTYVEGFKPLIDRKTGLIKTSFNQTVTATGRLSSKEPNLQNIPVRDEEGKELRKFFVPRDKDRVLISADYSQIELRLLAAFSGCPSLIEAFKKGEDVHAETASKVFGVSIQDITPEMRRKAKAVNFGIIYGISEYGLAKNINSTPKLAKDYISAYFREYPEVKNYLDGSIKFAKDNGYAITLLGRRRYISELQSQSYAIRQFGERVAMNMPLQGSAADIIKIAMINVFNRLSKEGLKSKLILQIHDELIVDTLLAEEEQVKKILTEEMEGAVSLAVPLTVGIGVGETWYDAK